MQRALSTRAPRWYALSIQQPGYVGDTPVRCAYAHGHVRTFRSTIGRTLGRSMPPGRTITYGSPLSSRATSARRFWMSTPPNRFRMPASYQVCVNQGCVSSWSACRAHVRCPRLMWHKMSLKQGTLLGGNTQPVGSQLLSKQAPAAKDLGKRAEQNAVMRTSWPAPLAGAQRRHHHVLVHARCSRGLHQRYGRIPVWTTNTMCSTAGTHSYVARVHEAHSDVQCDHETRGQETDDVVE